jgi:hypothetical protein
MHWAVILILLSWLSLGFSLKQSDAALDWSLPNDKKLIIDWNVILKDTEMPFDWGENLTTILDGMPKRTYWADTSCYEKATNSAPNQPQGNFNALMRMMFEMASPETRSHHPRLTPISLTFSRPSSATTPMPLLPTRHLR